VRPAPFEYFAPRSVEEALDLLARHGEDAKLLAGGQSLVPMMNLRLVQPAAIVDLNRVAELAYVRQAGDDLACVFAAPFKHDAFIDQAEPDPAYAKKAREICDATGALLVVDDVRAGLRVARDCSWTKVGVQPDLSTWGKCIANGHSLSALLGSDKARKAASAIYVTGSFWYQAAPMAAALETLRLVRESAFPAPDGMPTDDIALRSPRDVYQLMAPYAEREVVRDTYVPPATPYVPPADRETVVEERRYE